MKNRLISQSPNQILKNESRFRKLTGKIHVT